MRPTTAQMRYLRFLARKANVEVPVVRDSKEAQDAITRLQLHLRQPALFR